MDRAPGKPIPISLRFLTDDESMREFARRYWAADYGPTLSFQYRENVGPLAQTYGWKIHEVKDKLAEIVVATYGTCSECFEPIAVRHRTDLYHKASAVVCQSCVDRKREARDREREELLPALSSTTGPTDRPSYRYNQPIRP